MRHYRFLFSGLAFAAALAAGPATAVNNAPAFSPIPKPEGLPLVMISCVGNCISAHKACRKKCLPGVNGYDCRTTCNTQKVQCQKAC